MNYEKQDPTKYQYTFTVTLTGDIPDKYPDDYYIGFKAGKKYIYTEWNDILMKNILKTGIEHLSPSSLIVEKVKIEVT